MIEARYVNHMGDDLMVVNAARVSFAKESEWGEENTLSDKDARLIDYLARHGHWTPFAHPQVCLHIKAPIFVRTQCFKHKVGFVENEVSRRYVDDEPEFYVPTTWRGRPEGGAKQGSSGALDANNGPKAGGMYAQGLAWAQYAYRELLARGVAPEQARMVLPQSMMTEWYWTGSLAAWARFVKQRTDAHAQAETGEVARAAAAIIEPLFPASWAALTS